MPKVTVLPYVSKRCICCGRDLPRGRKAKCYLCRPPRPHKPIEAPKEAALYTLEDRVAMARAYGMSYGVYMSYIHTGERLPPMKHPIVWPVGSNHIGE